MEEDKILKMYKQKEKLDNIDDEIIKKSFGYSCFRLQVVFNEFIKTITKSINKEYASGKWYKFIIPKRLTLPPTRIYRWLNFFWRLKDKEEKTNVKKRKMYR